MFWLGLMLILVFGVQRRLLPVARRGGWERLILRTVSLEIMLAVLGINCVSDWLRDFLDRRLRNE